MHGLAHMPDDPCGTDHKQFLDLGSAQRVQYMMDNRPVGDVRQGGNVVSISGPRSPSCPVGDYDYPVRDHVHPTRDLRRYSRSSVAAARIIRVHPATSNTQLTWMTPNDDLENTGTA
jgi:hypothetical protein